MSGEAASRPVFPCERLPEDPAAARLLGLYPQRQPGRWMQRIKVLGGRLAAEQWRALAAAASEFTPGAPLHLTTRQDVELHDLSVEDVPAVQRRLWQAGLTGLGACGDTLRNLTVCPCAGALAGTVDLVPLAWQVRRALEGLPGAFDLPRKFKIDLSCGRGDCGRPWINDLGLVADRRGGRWGFAVCAGGSLGPRPGAGMALLEWVPADEVAALAVAAVEFFGAHGDRENRSRARLRHVRQRMGDAAFAAALRERFEREKHARPPAAVALPPAPPGLGEPLTLTFPNGDVTPSAAEALGALAGREQLRVRIAAGHQVVVFGRGAGAQEAVESLEPLRSPAEPQPSVAACPGTRWCARALVDTNGLADRLRKLLPPGPTVRISGCPNGCAHSAAAPIGLLGARVRRGGRAAEAYDLYVGGRLGRTAALATRVARRLSPAQAVAGVMRVVAAAGESRGPSPGWQSAGTSLPGRAE